MQLGNKITEFRNKTNISQRELGRRAGISGQMISKIENNSTNPSLSTLSKIAKVLECDINDLLGYEYTSDDIEFLDAPLGDNGELKNFCTLLELLGYKFRDNEGNYTIFNDKEEPILTCTPEELISYSSKITNSLKDFLEITIKHLL